MKRGGGQTRGGAGAEQRCNLDGDGRLWLHGRRRKLRHQGEKGLEGNWACGVAAVAEERVQLREEHLLRGGVRKERRKTQERRGRESGMETKGGGVRKGGEEGGTTGRGD